MCSLAVTPAPACIDQSDMLEGYSAANPAAKHSNLQEGEQHMY